jgi:hypothetical protein
MVTNSAKETIFLDDPFPDLIPELRNIKNANARVHAPVLALIKRQQASQLGGLKK